MKEKSRASKPQPQKDVNLKSSSTNLFFNIIILLLAIVIAFLGYSLFLKVQDSGKVKAEEINKETPAAIIQLEVLNGCGKAGVADKFTDYLRKRNFDVVQIGNYISFDIDKSMVIDRSGNKANAFKVADALGIDRKNVIQQLNNDYFLDVSLIIGRDFNQLNPNN